MHGATVEQENVKTNTRGRSANKIAAASATGSKHSKVSGETGLKLAGEATDATEKGVSSAMALFGHIGRSKNPMQSPFALHLTSLGATRDEIKRINETLSKLVSHA